jgi:hypothetical protein
MEVVRRIREHPDIDPNEAPSLRESRTFAQCLKHGDSFKEAFWKALGNKYGKEMEEKLREAAKAAGRDV